MHGCSRRLATLALAVLVLSPGAVAAQAASSVDSVRRLVALGRHQEAFDYGRRVARRRPSDPAAQSARALGAMAAERHGEAVAAAEHAASLTGETSASQLILGQAYLSHARANPSLGAISKVKKGRAAVERAITLNPDNLDARHTLMQFLLQAPGIVGGSREEAARQAAEIERRDPERGLLARLEVAASGEDEDQLRRVFRDALPRMAASDTAGRLIGEFLGLAGRLDDERLGQELTDLVHTAHPDHPIAWYHRARLWVIAGERPAEAERLLLDYLAGPERRGGVASRAGAHWRLAQLYDRQDRRDRAEEQYRLAGALDARLKGKRKLPERLKSRI